MTLDTSTADGYGTGTGTEDAPVAVVVLNYEGGEAVLTCLRSVQASEQPVELVVVDNASSDGSLERIAEAFPEATLICNARNRGFGAAANQGIWASTAPYIVLLNQDATVEPVTVGRLARALTEHPRAAAVGALVRNPDGSVQPSKRAFPTLWQAALHGFVGLVWPQNPGTRAYTLADADTSVPRAVDWVSASAVALRREAVQAVGGFDEAFFFFVEDVDLCKRLHDAGWEIWFEPRAEVTHAWGGSWTRRPVRFLWLHHRNLFLYVRKHRRGLWVLAYPVIAGGLALRFAALSLRWLIARRSVPVHRGRPNDPKEVRS